MVKAAPSRESEASAWLSSEAGAGRVRELRSWKPADREALLRKVEGALAAWGHDHGLEVTETLESASCQPLPEASALDLLAPLVWNALTSPDGAGGVWWSLAPSPDRTKTPDDPATLLAEVLFDQSDEASRLPAPGSLAQEVSWTAWSEACARIGSALGLGPEVLSAPGSWPRSLARPWSGALTLQVPFCGRRLLLVLDPDRVRAGLGTAPNRRSPAPQGNLIPVLRAAGARSLPLEVRLQPFELDLGSLMTLTPGDILRIPHALETPFEVCSRLPEGTGSNLFGGYLGKQGTHRAVQLTRRS